MFMALFSHYFFICLSKCMTIFSIFLRKKTHIWMYFQIFFFVKTDL